MTGIFGTTFEYHNFVTSAMMRVSFHVAGYRDIDVLPFSSVRSDPPVTRTPLSGYMDTFSLSKHIVAFSNKKIQRIVGYHLKRPNMTADVLYEIVDKWKAEGSWPTIRS